MDTRGLDASIAFKRYWLQTIGTWPELRLPKQEMLEPCQL